MIDQNAGSAILAESITKRYPGVTAVDAVTFGVSAGEIRALVGKNGAGKSTLTRILSGAERPDGGRLLVGGRPVSFDRPLDAVRAGIATVYQELSVVPQLSVTENIVLGSWPLSRYGTISWRSARSVAQAALDQLEEPIEPDVPVGNLSLAQQQMVEIARAVSRRSSVLILDEPTSALSINEVATLHRLLRRLSQRGVAVIYISHRLEEIQNIASSVTVMRDGRSLATLPIADASSRRIAELMIGEAVSERPASASSRRATSGQPLLSVSDLRIDPKVRNVAFALSAGEILGIAGVLGSGRTEILGWLAGDLSADQGSLYLEGKRMVGGSVRHRIACGIVLSPESRKRQGVIAALGVDENILLTWWASATSAGLISPAKVADVSGSIIDRLNIKVTSPKQSVGTLSGGNQQKVVIGKWLHGPLRVLLLDEPTRGVDIQAKVQLFEIVRTLAETGIGVILVSEDFKELVEVCDRILVLRDGRITDELEGRAASEAVLMQLAASAAGTSADPVQPQSSQEA